MARSQELYIKAKRLIPGGTQLLSKRPEMFLPDFWPAYYQKAKGCEIWDLDGNKYTDMSYMGIGACILGYADDDVDAAVHAAVDNGSMATLNAPQEVELAELLISLHPWASMVRYARTGGESLAVAVRIARAFTGRDTVLFCGYHGWHDWYLAANLAEEQALDGHLIPGLSPRGTPRALRGSSYPFVYNDVEGLKKLALQHKNDAGVIVIEAIRNHFPDKEFIAAVMSAARDLKAVVIVDEVSSGWRMTCGGAHLLFGLEPDIAVFAKGMSNGFPMAAVIGKENVMQAAQESFISSTYWTDSIGPTAALATIKKLRDKNVPEYLQTAGKKVQEGWKKIAAAHGLAIEASGIFPMGHFEFRHPEPLVLKTLFTQLMLEKGFLATNAYYASLAHTPETIDRYLKAVDEAFGDIATAVSSGSPARLLKGPVCHTGFKRLT